MKQAPLFVQTMALAEWVTVHFHGEGPLFEKTHRDTLALLDHVVLAFKRVHERSHHLEEADDLAALIRVRLRLACRAGLIDERRLLFLTKLIDDIGRQIGGWMRAMKHEHQDVRHR